MGAAGSSLLQAAENRGFDPGNATHVVAASVPGAIAYGVVNNVMEQQLYRPLGFSKAGIRDTPDAPQIIGVKFQTWCSALLAHCGMWGFWWKWVAEGNHWGWVLDPINWTDATMPKMAKSDTAERKSIGPYYVMYFSYVLHSCYKDMLKSAGRKGGSMQWLFDLHHLVAVGLVATSIRWGGWRAGVLTRLIHDVADIVLYASKLQQSMYESGKSSNANLKKWFVANLIAWAGTRIGLYGWFCLKVNGLMRRIWNELKEQLPMWPYLSQLAGCWVMFGLQVAFFGGLVDAAQKFWKTGGVADPFHGKSNQKGLHN